MSIEKMTDATTISTPVPVAVMGDSLTKKVTVKTSASTVDVVPGQLIFLDEKTNKCYVAAAVSTDYATTVPTTRCVVAIEAKTATTEGVEIRCVYAGKVYSQGVRKAGHTTTLLPGWVLDKVAGISGITFVEEA
jgi:hypothetical protein